LATISQLFTSVHDTSIDQALSKLSEALANDLKFRVTRRKRQTQADVLRCDTLANDFDLDYASLNNHISKHSIIEGVLKVLEDINQPLLEKIIVLIKLHKTSIEKLIHIEKKMMDDKLSASSKCAATRLCKLSC
jgi:hypothetical protein